MARIYIGRSTGIGSFERHVVLKMILPERANDHTSVQMFLDEARLAASLNHQNVAQVFEVGEEGGIHFLAMEYVHGQDLRALLAKAGSTGTRVPLELALTVVAGAASGLNHAHERHNSDGTPMGIVHRDVSPSNLMIGYDGAVKLLDFGIAKATSRSVETQSGIIKGKFAYMAPEQCRGRDVDRRSDVFSLGIILYEVTTQHRCFRADSDFDTMHRIVTGDVVRPTRLVQGYPLALEAIVMKALAVDAGQRYQSAGLLLEAVENFAVAARMSLSTMSLGRFMRDLFGEVQEPWLASGRISQPLPAKEQTISNTNATGGRPPGRPPSVPPVRHDHAPMHLPPEVPDELASAFESRGIPAGPEDASAGTAARDAMAYAQDGGTSPGPPPLAPAPPYHPRPTARTGLAGGTQPLPAPQFGAQPGSGSGPAHASHPAFSAQPVAGAAHASHPLFPVQPGSGADPVQPMPSTRQGYANAPGMSRSDISQQRYQPPYDGEVVRLQPHNRILYIGLGIALVGVIVLLAIVIVDGSDDLPAPPSRPSSSIAPAPAPSKPEGPATPAAVAKPVAPAPRTLTPEPVKPEAFRSAPVAAGGAAAPAGSESISIHVVSTPPGADVTLAGKRIGTTPFTIKVPRAAGTAPLTIHRARFADVTASVDLRGDVSKDVTLTAIADDASARPPAREPAPAAPHDRSMRIAPRDSKPHAPGAAAASPCQRADRVNPFDESCGGKPCPVCPPDGASKNASP